MSIIIDGHNLIGKYPGIHLDDIDDENRMVELLIDFCRREGKRAEVYFDRAAPGQQGVRQHGPIRVHYVRSDSSADDAIRRRLARLGKTAPNWTVVTSDRPLQRSARAARARVLSAEDFITWMSTSSQDPKPEVGADRSLTNAEIQFWQEFFKKPPDQEM